MKFHRFLCALGIHIWGPYRDISPKESFLHEDMLRECRCCGLQQFSVETHDGGRMAWINHNMR